jgi:predicted transcriptional regulator
MKKPSVSSGLSEWLQETVKASDTDSRILEEIDKQLENARQCGDLKLAPTARSIAAALSQTYSMIRCRLERMYDSGVVSRVRLGRFSYWCKSSPDQ